MTPGARVAAAIEILTDMADGCPAEQALTRWARRSRFAGSKDRAAIRDYVFDLLRCRNTAAYYGGSDAPRALMRGLLYAQGADLASLFTGEGHAPQPLSEAEKDFPEASTDRGICWNLPGWLLGHFEESLGDRAASTASALAERAPVTLRVNLAKSTRAAARKSLAAQEIETTENTLAETALTVTSGQRGLRASLAFEQGDVELQDAASQAVIAALPGGGRVLDFCAGGGGKALALAVDASRQVLAHDIDPRRMADLPVRAARAGSRIYTVDIDALKEIAPFDVVLCDAPCSGSGAWRRAPEGKWILTSERLQDLNTIQDDILDQAAALTAPRGILAYATCSVLRVENEDRIDAFHRRNPGWRSTFVRRFDVDGQGDGFFTAHLTRSAG